MAYDEKATVEVFLNWIQDSQGDLQLGLSIT